MIVTADGMSMLQRGCVVRQPFYNITNTYDSSVPPTSSVNMQELHPTYTAHNRIQGCVGTTHHYPLPITQLYYDEVAKLYSSTHGTEMYLQREDDL